MKMYKIKPFEWEPSYKGCHMMFLDGDFYVHKGPLYLMDDEEGECEDEYFARYIFNEWHDEDSKGGFKSIEEAKAWCESIALERILKYLEEV